MTVVAVLAGSEDATLAGVARATLSKLPAPILQGALTADLPGTVILELARAYPNQHEVVTALLRMPRIGTVAARADGRRSRRTLRRDHRHERRADAQEPDRDREAVHEQARCACRPPIAWSSSPCGTTSSSAIPAFAEAAQAIKNELILEAPDEPYFDDVLFKEATQLGEKLHLDEANPDTHEVDDEGEEKPKPGK